MTVIHTAPNQEVADAGEDELTLVALRYTGGRSIYRDQQSDTQGGWPSLGTFTPGTPKVALVPSRRLGYWERQSHFTIGYSPAEIAEAMLEQNYLPSNVFGAGYDPRLRNRVLDHLDIDAERSTAAYRETLAEVAGIDQREAGTESTPDPNAIPYNEYTRTELQAAVGQLEDHTGIATENVDGAEFGNISHAKNTELIAYLDHLRNHEEYGREPVSRALRAVAAGEDFQINTEGAVEGEGEVSSTPDPDPDPDPESEGV